MRSNVCVLIFELLFIVKILLNFVAILALYLTDALGYSEALALTIYLAWVAMCYFTPVIGAILADSFLGKFRTIFYISIIYAIGQLVLTFGSYSESGSTMAL